MKKALSFPLVILAGLLLSAFVAWANKTHIVANFLSQELHVPIAIRSVHLNRDLAILSRITAGNPPRSKSKSSFSASQVQINTTWRKLVSNPLLIEEIKIDDIFISVELYNQDGTDNNWSHILRKNKNNQKKIKPYLIKRLTLNNITVELVHANGTIKRYPPIEQMIFADISSESGFPAGELEKALFRIMMQDIFQRFNLNQLLQTIGPFDYIPGGIPLPFFPGFF